MYVELPRLAGIDFVRLTSLPGIGVHSHVPAGLAHGYSSFKAYVKNK